MIAFPVHLGCEPSSRPAPWQSLQRLGLLWAHSKPSRRTELVEERRRDSPVSAVQSELLLKAAALGEIPSSVTAGNITFVFPGPIDKI